MMLRFQIKWRPGKLNRAIRRSRKPNLMRAGGAIRKTARRSMRRRKGPAAPGRPPHAHEGALKNALAYAMDDPDTVVVGPRHSRVGILGAKHEHGGTFDGETFPERPFMRPAMEKLADDLPGYWRNAVTR